ncbi:recombinase family protein [Ensifer adhaerens]
MNNKEQKLAVIYCRVSSVKQSTAGDGLNSQETRCRDFARMKGYEVHEEIYTDDVSGSLVNRPGMKLMLDFIRRRKARGTVVIIDDVSRLARGLDAHLELRRLIASAGGVLESPSIEFGDDPDSILVENLLASVSQHHRQKNGQQTINRMKARVQNGYFVFQAPVGYRYERVSGRGKMLVRDEPEASVVQEALEGYAFGRFETQADVMRFLQTNPLFPRKGSILNHRVFQLLSQPVYAGFVEAPRWGVTRRLGHHEALITAQTYTRIQDRMNGHSYAPRRKNLNEEFPLRGFVECADCGTPLTACWSAGEYAKYPYYLCPKKGCASYRKSIRREKIEGEFEELLKNVQPTEQLFNVATSMLKKLWDHRLAQAQSQINGMKAELVSLDREVGTYLQRIVQTAVPSVVSAYENQIGKLEERKVLVREQIVSAGRPRSTLEDTVRTALGFLANPWNLWKTELPENRRTVMKLTFSQRLAYRKNEGFRTANLTLPFNMLGGILGSEKRMARPPEFQQIACGQIA